MPAFSAIATYLVEAAITAGVTMSAAAAGFAISVVATGLALITSRLVNGTGSRGGSGSQDQGVRVQLPPNTEIKIPIVYGSVYQQGIITDARISNQNRTMTYVLTLSEYTNSLWTTGDIYWNDQRLVFESDGYTVNSTVAQDGTTNENLRGLVRVWVYAGGSASTHQISGPSPAVNAYDIFADATGSEYAMSDLVFAVVQMDYNSERGTTGLPTMTFQLHNSLRNPGSVWYDYMTNTRYGAGFTATEVDSVMSISTTTATSLWSVSNEIPANQFTPWPESTSTTTTATYQVRYEINGILNTGDTVKTNLEKINQASASYTSYDHKTGQWRVIPLRALTTSEINSCYVFTDDNIIGDITLTATNLEDIYNQVETGYASRSTRDQTDYYRYQLPAADLNELEPVNPLKMSVSLVNNSIHAGRISQIELQQSRRDLVVNFQSDYGALQVEAGDVVKVTNSTYGFDQKLFRVTRIRETEGEDGTLATEVAAIEYSGSVYRDSTLTDTGATPVSDIPIANSTTGLPTPGAPVITYSTATEAVPYFIVSIPLANSGYPVDTVSLYYSNTSTSSYMLLKTLTPIGPQFYPGNTATTTINTVPYGTWYFRAQTNLAGNHSAISTASTAFAWDPQPGSGGGGYWPPGGGGDPGFDPYYY